MEAAWRTLLIVLLILAVVLDLPLLMLLCILLGLVQATAWLWQRTCLMRSPTGGS